MTMLHFFYANFHGAIFFAHINRALNTRFLAHAKFTYSKKKEIVINKRKKSLNKRVYNNTNNNNSIQYKYRKMDCSNGRRI